MRTIIASWMALGLFLVGCDDGNMAPADSGAGRDGAMAADAAMGVDAAMGEDAGSTDDAGSAMDAAMGDDGGSSSDAGASDDAATADGGMSGACSPAPLQVMDTCPAFAPCGGAVDGAWCYTGVCITTAELVGGLMDVCPGITLTSSSGTVTGRIEFTGSGSSAMLARQVSLSGMGSAFVPQSCVVAAGSCANLPTVVAPLLPAGLTATCADTKGGCDCDFMLESDVDQNDPYSIVGNVITTTTSSGARSFDYCVEADGSLRFHETTAGGEPGVQSVAPGGA